MQLGLVIGLGMADNDAGYLRLMKLLALSTWHPHPPDNGARIRAWNLLSRLADRHAVRVVCGRQSDSPTDIPAEVSGRFESFQAVDWRWHDGNSGGKSAQLAALLSPVPRSIRTTKNPALDAAVRSELDRKPDLILALQMGMDAHLPTLPPEIPAVLEEAEITLWDQAASAGGLRARLTRDKARGYWRSRLARYAAITTVSDAESEAVRALLGGPFPPVSVISNGVEIVAAPPVRNPAAGRLLYNGALGYGPNEDAVRWFLNSILPKIAERAPAAHLMVTGRVPESCRDLEENPRVCLTGYLPDLERPLAEAEICVVPLRAGGGTRLKILEAWAAGVPVVSTSVGAAGLSGAADGVHLRLADDPEGFASAVVSLLENPAERESLSAEGRRLAAERYDWDAITDSLDAVLREAARR